MGLSTLPYDLLLNIALYLDLSDIHALHRTCKTLNDFTTTRPVYRKLATDLLRKCRALPLKGFQRLTDLNTEQLIRSVNQAAQFDTAWRRRAPRPIGTLTSAYGTSHYMDGPLTSTDLALSSTHHPARTWYKVVSAPPDEEVDWLSPITSSYTLCATKSGKVVCWDVQSDSCLAEWNPGERWELWKCRVEFEERTVYFTMAKILDGSQDDSRMMEFVLMRLTFSDPPSGESSADKPVFSRVTEFRTTGVVMNIFLLDPAERLLSAFVWVASSNTIGLYALLDWSKREYVFLDTGIEYAVSANWSCILYDEHIVIHCEEPEAAHQYFYPFSLLRANSARLLGRLSPPHINGRVPPARTLTKKFTFPSITLEPQQTSAATTANPDEDMVWLNTISPHMVLLLPSITPAQATGAAPTVISSTTAATAATTSISASSSFSSSSSSSSSSNATALIQSPSSVTSPPSSSPSQQFASSSSPPSSSASMTSSSTITSTSSGPMSPPIPTPPAPLLSHATLPPFHQQPLQQTQLLLPSAVPHPNTAITTTTGTPTPNASQSHIPIVVATTATDHNNNGNNDNDNNDSSANPNPFPFPTWYPESAHFVRQWWPSLPGIPRVSCTVVLLAMHDQETHRNRFVLAQHYFKVPIDWGMWVRGEGGVGGLDDSGSGSGEGGNQGDNGIHDRRRKRKMNGGGVEGDQMEDEEEERPGDDDLMKMWYVSKPFEVVRVFDDNREEDDNNQMPERPRPLVAVDFGHAVWIEYCDEDVVVPAAAAATLPHDPDPEPSPPPSSLVTELRERFTFGDGAREGGNKRPLDASEIVIWSDPGIRITDNGGSAGAGSAGPSSVSVRVEESTTEDDDGEDDEDMVSAPPSGSMAGAVISHGLAMVSSVLGERLDEEHDHEPDSEPKALKFVTFPAYEDGYEEDGWYEEEIEIEVDEEEEEEVELEVEFKSAKGKGKQRATAVDPDAQTDHHRNGVNGSAPLVNGFSSSSSTPWSYTNGTHAPSAPKKKKKVWRKKRRNRETEGVVRTLEVPDELDLGMVETINIDQSQGAVILSDRDGKIFILCYE